MTTIQVTVSGKVALCRKQVLISANEDYQLQFLFDDDWNISQTKTARLLFDGQSVDLVFTGTTVALPRIPPCDSLAVGVFTPTMASTMAPIGCIRSVADVDAAPAQTFTPSQYDQIVALLNEADLRQIDTIFRSGDTLLFAFRDGSGMQVPLHDGVDITAAAINNSGELILTRSDGTVLNAGAIPVSGGSGSLDTATFNALLSQTFQAHFDQCVAALGTAEGGSY
ncbi:MAG: hypothetical protein IKN72_08190 [Clostridia bacterium]|nr:hypothetical protein [Clostridia bacterium]MBR3553352.1 hypothetical protein [Clostridia bacterium]